MKVKKMSNQTYKELIMYSLGFCNKFSLYKYKLMGIPEIEEKHILDFIFNYTKFSKEKFLSKYSKNMLDKIYNQCKENRQLFEEAENRLKQSNYNYFINLSSNERILGEKRLINSAIESFIYNYKHEEFKKYFKDKFKSLGDDNPSIYLVDYNKYAAKFILNNSKNINDWLHPMNLDNLSLYINDIPWLYSVPHENICDIYCRSEEEYKYLKSIGVEFKEKNFVQDKYN